VTNSGITTLYALDNSGTTRLLPLGSSATLDMTHWLSSPEQGGGPTFNLGTFNLNAGDMLTLNGASMLTYQGGGDIASSSYLNYRISPLSGPFSSFVPGDALGLNESNVAGQPGDIRWSTESLNRNLLIGLAPGTYILGTYGYVNDAGNQYASDGGLNFGATFTVVPEPTSAVILGLGCLVMTFRRRH
jgi:hypothetical protein